MAKFLSQRWLDELVAALEAGGGSPEASITVQQVVTDAPDGRVELWIAFASGRITAGLGRLAEADVTITEDHPTCVALARGELNLQGAFMQGKLKITGNMGKLLHNQAALEGLGPVMGSLQTDY